MVGVEPGAASLGQYVLDVVDPVGHGVVDELSDGDGLVLGIFHVLRLSFFLVVMLLIFVEDVESHRTYLHGMIVEKGDFALQNNISDYMKISNI